MERAATRPGVQRVCHHWPSAIALEAANPRHFHRPIERAFTAAERNRVTILFGGLTWKHERLIRAAFESAAARPANQQTGGATTIAPKRKTSGRAFPEVSEV